MQPLIRKYPVLFTAVLLIVIMFVSTACLFTGISLSGNSATVTITLKQDQVNTVFNNIIDKNDSSSDVLLTKITGIEFHDGFIRVLGTASAPDGSDVAGSYDVSFTAANNLLQVKIIAVNISGITLDDPRIADANANIAKSLADSVAKSNGDVLYKAASVTAADGLKLTVQVNFQSK